MENLTRQILNLKKAGFRREAAVLEKEAAMERWAFIIESATAEEVYELLKNTDLKLGSKYDKKYPGVLDQIRKGFEDFLTTGSGNVYETLRENSKWAWRNFASYIKKETAEILEAVKNNPNNVNLDEQEWITNHFKYDRVAYSLRRLGEIKPLLDRYNIKFDWDEANKPSVFGNNGRSLYPYLDRILADTREKEEYRELKERMIDEVQDGNSPWYGDIQKQFKDGWAIWEIEGEEDIELEGELASHCIADRNQPHCGLILDGKTRAFSLRDKYQIPWATIETSPDLETVYEAFGRHDHPIKPEHQKMIAAWFVEATGNENHEYMSNKPEGQWTGIYNGTPGRIEDYDHDYVDITQYNGNYISYLSVSDISDLENLLDSMREVESSLGMDWNGWADYFSMGDSLNDQLDEEERADHEEEVIHVYENPNWDIDYRLDEEIENTLVRYYSDWDPANNEYNEEYTEDIAKTAEGFTIAKILQYSRQRTDFSYLEEEYPENFAIKAYNAAQSVYSKAVGDNNIFYIDNLDEALDLFESIIRPEAVQAILNLAAQVSNSSLPNSTVADLEPSQEFKPGQTRLEEPQLVLIKQMLESGNWENLRYVLEDFVTKMEPQRGASIQLDIINPILQEMRTMRQKSQFYSLDPLKVRLWIKAIENEINDLRQHDINYNQMELFSLASANTRENRLERLQEVIWGLSDGSITPDQVRNYPIPVGVGDFILDHKLNDLNNQLHVVKSSPRRLKKIYQRAYDLLEKHNRKMR
jgi:hypothetical protein